MQFRFQHIMISCFLLLQLLIPNSSIALEQQPLRIQPYLESLSIDDPNEVVSVIIQKKSENDEPEQFVQNSGGVITNDYPFMHAFSANLKAGILKELAALNSVQWVSLNAPLYSSNATEGSQTNLRDDFTVPMYDGSSGGREWKSVWQEIGEEDGPLAGDVAITSFWGGAVQGLRIKGNEKGLWRTLDFGNNSQTAVSIAYRRKDFQAGDVVTLQISDDGGTSWSDIAQLTGPATDAEIQYATYAINARNRDSSAIRIINHSAENSSALFYLDFIEFRHQPPGEGALQTSKIYLPLVSNTGEQQTSQAQSAASQSSPAEQSAAAQPSRPAQSAAYKENRSVDVNVDEQDLSMRAEALRKWKQQRNKSQDTSRMATALKSSYISTIRADAVWSKYPSLQGTGIGVAILDSGISPHWDLWDDYGTYRVIKQVQFGDYATISGGPDDYYGHGTHIAGAIIGDGWLSDREYPGLAHRANAIDVKVTNDFGFGNMSDAVAGLQWIFNNRTTYNIKIVNLSLNSTVPEPYNTSALNAALEILWFNKVVVVVSAGNKGSQQLYPPANDPFVITVGAVDDKGTASTTDDVVAPYSAFGVTESGFAKPDIVAPGSNIVSLLASDDSNLFLQYPSNIVYAGNGANYFRISGTSMSSAVVSGAVALLMQDEPNLTPDQIKYRLKATARPLANQSGCAAGAGQLDIYAAVTGTTSQSANTGIPVSKLLWNSTSSLNWSSVNWNSVNWNSVNWNSVNWNSVNWNSFNRNSINWNSTSIGNATSNSNCTASIEELVLINANTSSDVQQIYDNAMLYTSRIGSNSLSIRANVVGTVESVKFELSGAASLTRIENGAPYALNGDSGSKYIGFTFKPGFYTLKVTAYSQDNASGTALVTKQIKFSVVSSSNCELEGSVRAISATTPVPMIIINTFDTPLEIFWINYSGQRQSYGKLAPWYWTWFYSYATHPWVIARDSDNACLYLVTDTALTPIVKGPQ